MPPLEIDQRYFTILAQTDSVAIVQHKISGSLSIWQVEWRAPSGVDALCFNGDQAGAAWAAYMSLTAGGS